LRDFYSTSLLSRRFENFYSPQRFSFTHVVRTHGWIFRPRDSFASRRRSFPACVMSPLGIGVAFQQIPRRGRYNESTGVSVPFAGRLRDAAQRSPGRNVLVHYHHSEIEFPRDGSAAWRRAQARIKSLRPPSKPRPLMKRTALNLKDFPSAFLPRCEVGAPGIRVLARNCSQPALSFSFSLSWTTSSREKEEAKVASGCNGCTYAYGSPRFPVSPTSERTPNELPDHPSALQLFTYLNKNRRW